MFKRSLRSWLVVPANKSVEIEGAAQAGADAVVIDLVEFVADKHKAAARAAVRAAVERVNATGSKAYVQTTPATHEADLAAAIGQSLKGVVVARAESAAQIQTIDKYLNTLEKKHGMRDGSVSLVIALETARGNQDACDIVTASKRVTAITLGRADLVMDLRPEPSGELHMMPYLMQRLVMLAGATGVTPLGAWWRAPDRGLLATPENTLKAAQRGRAMGFKGALCLRADQVASLNAAYA